MYDLTVYDELFSFPIFRFQRDCFNFQRSKFHRESGPARGRAFTPLHFGNAEVVDNHAGVYYISYGCVEAVRIPRIHALAHMLCAITSAAPLLLASATSLFDSTHFGVSDAVRNRNRKWFPC